MSHVRVHLTQAVHAWIADDPDNNDFTGLSVSRHFTNPAYGVDEHDAQQNQNALSGRSFGYPGRVLTVHETLDPHHPTLWIITEWSDPLDPITTVLFPEDY